MQEEFPYTKDVWGDLNKYFSKSFSTLLGVSNKMPVKDVILNYELLSFFRLQNDYKQSEIIEGLIQNWEFIIKKKRLLKQICNDFSINSSQYEYIKKEGQATFNKI